MQPAGHTQFYTTLTDATQDSAPGKNRNFAAPESEAA